MISIIFMKYSFEMLLEQLHKIQASEEVLYFTAVYSFMIARILWCKKLGSQLNRHNMLITIRDHIKSPLVLECLEKGLTEKGLMEDGLTDKHHIKHAITLSVFFFLNLDNYTYESAVELVTKIGGECNLKIIENLFGAYYGIPDYKKIKDVYEKLK